MIRELPIIMCAEEVKAIYEDRKSNMRRLIDLPSDVEWQFEAKMKDGTYCFEHGKGLGYGCCFRKPRYQVGDELWVCQAWAADRQYDSLPPRAIPTASSIWFSDELGWKHDKHMGKVRSSYFMRKDFARLWLRVTAVKDPRQIQEMSINDIRAEGVCDTRTPQNEIVETYYEKFSQLWNRLHKKPGERWEDDPWVFPTVFKRIER